MIIKGKVHKFGNDINTDDIIAAKYLVTTCEKELGKHCMENIAADFLQKVNKGDIIVAGKNFGCGSSREHAPRALKGCGIAAVIARSFAGIFFRNSINVGLPFLQLEEADKIKEGDLLEIDLTGGIIRNLSTGQTYKTEPFPKFLEEIIKRGGLINYIKKLKQ
jgi:3-isopropylmalate/(R)-2-methylmalate dehydratase small subunit